MTCWEYLPASDFPATYNLEPFLRSASTVFSDSRPIVEISSFFTMGESILTYRCFTFKKKKINTQNDFSEEILYSKFLESLRLFWKRSGNFLIKTISLRKFLLRKFKRKCNFSGVIHFKAMNTSCYQRERWKYSHFFSLT